MPYWRMFCHLVWATKWREASIGEKEEAIILGSMKSTINELGVVPHAIGMMPDHVHAAVSVPPKIAVADLVRRLKGASAHAVNAAGERGTERRFGWQAEYGAVSFGERNLPEVVAYVLHQRERHAAGRLWEKLERIEEEKAEGRGTEPEDDEED